MKTLKAKVIKVLNREEWTKLRETGKMCWLYVFEFHHDSGFFVGKDSYLRKFIVTSNRKPKNGDVLEFKYKEKTYLMKVDSIYQDLSKITNVYSRNPILEIA